MWGYLKAKSGWSKQICNKMWKYPFNRTTGHHLIDISVSQWNPALRPGMLSDLSRLFGSVSTFMLNSRSWECLFRLLSAATSGLLLLLTCDVDLWGSQIQCQCRRRNTDTIIDFIEPSAFTFQLHTHTEACARPAVFNYNLCLCCLFH